MDIRVWQTSKNTFAEYVNLGGPSSVLKRLTKIQPVVAFSKICHKLEMSNSSSWPVGWHCPAIACKSTHAYDKCVLLEQIELGPSTVPTHHTLSKTPHAKTNDTNLYTGPEPGKIFRNVESLYKRIWKNDFTKTNNMRLMQDCTVPYYCTPSKCEFSIGPERHWLLSCHWIHC